MVNIVMFEEERRCEIIVGEWFVDKVVKMDR